MNVASNGTFAMDHQGINNTIPSWNKCEQFANDVIQRAFKNRSAMSPGQAVKNDCRTSPRWEGTCHKIFLVTRATASHCMCFAFSQHIFRHWVWSMFENNHASTLAYDHIYIISLFNCIQYVCVCVFDVSPANTYVCIFPPSNDISHLLDLATVSRGFMGTRCPQYTVLLSINNFCRGGVRGCILISMIFSTIIQLCVWFVSGHPGEFTNVLALVTSFAHDVGPIHRIHLDAAQSLFQWYPSLWFQAGGWAVPSMCCVYLISASLLKLRCVSMSESRSSM